MKEDHLNTILTMLTQQSL